MAALYDVHANLPALEAVLAEVVERSTDMVVVGGDIAWGAFPLETVDRLRGLGSDAIFIRGNADREVADPQMAGLEGAVAEVNEWCALQLSDDQRAFLRGLPLTASIDLGVLGEALFCHATPRRDSDIFTAITPDDQTLQILGDFSEPTLVCGHTHVQFDRTIGNKRVINAGSVGMPYEEQPGAYWAFFDGHGLSLERTSYDFDAAALAISRSGFPHADEFAKGVTSPPSPAAATESFEKRVAW